MLTLNEYKDEVLRYAPGSDVLPDTLRISTGPDGLSTWYAPFEYVNKGAKIVLCGITPGLQQAHVALSAARDALTRGESVEAAQIRAKETGSFAGVMRTNLASMLDSIEINRLLEIESCSQLFAKRSDLVHYTSALRYPVLKDGGNYSGDSKMVRNSYLWNQIADGLQEESKALPDALWVPLGPVVGAVFQKIIEMGVISESRCLLGMPHASGANSERIKYFLGEKSRENLSSKTNAQLIDDRRKSLVRKVEVLLWPQSLKGSSGSLIDKSLPICEPETQKSSQSRTAGKLHISAKVARGQHKGETLLPHRHPDADDKYVVSKTRFVKDYVYLDNIGDIPQYLDRGYGLRMSMPKSSVAASLVVPGSITVQLV
tara:strand:+ start:46 stop:1164 length:1119 start_codon:yes stop_codon:yes gene_type:complete